MKLSGDHSANSEKQRVSKEVILNVRVSVVCLAVLQLYATAALLAREPQWLISGNV